MELKDFLKETLLAIRNADISLKRTAAHPAHAVTHGMEIMGQCPKRSLETRASHNEEQMRDASRERS
jgi:hypothetical protein